MRQSALRQLWRLSGGTLVALVLLYLHFFQQTLPWVGTIGGLLFLFAIGAYWRTILHHVLGLSPWRITTFLFSWFSAWLLLSFISGISVAWYRLDGFSIMVSYVLTAVISAVLMVMSASIRSRSRVSRTPSMPHRSPTVPLPKSWIGVMIYLGVVMVIPWLFASARSSAALSTPWESIPSVSLVFVFCALVLLGLLLISKHRTTTLLFCIIASSVVLHVYLPLSHEMPWGGDAWRHMAYQEILANEQPINPVLIGDDVSFTQIGSVSLPTVLVFPQKYIYAQFWGINTLMHETFSVPFRGLMIWLIPLIWGVMIPLIFFRIGRLLWGHTRYGLWLAGLSLIPFTLQAIGSLSLPVSLGYVSFFYWMMLWLQYQRDQQRVQGVLVYGMLVLLGFGYTVHAIIALGIVFFTLLLKLLIPGGRNTLFGVARAGVMLAAIAFLPFVELVSHTSVIVPVQVADRLVAAVGELSGWYVASAIRPHDILSGNIFMNHVPEMAFVSSVFTDIRWHVIVWMMLVWIFVGIALALLIREYRYSVWQSMLVLSIMTIGGYVIGWYVLSGDRSFVRRLDPMMAFSLLVLLLYTISVLQHVQARSSLFKKAVPIGFVFLASWIGTTALASGPDMRVVSHIEYDVAQLVWSQQQDDASYCTLADTWVLLALEEISAREQIGGGFSIDYQFGQQERVVLYEQLREDPPDDLREQIFATVNAPKCILVVPEENTRDTHREIYGTPLKEIEGFSLWQIEQLPDDEKSDTLDTEDNQ